MLADVINYGHWKTGIRVHALIFSTFTVGQKFGGGVAGWAIGQLMQLSGFTGSTTETMAAVAMIKNLYIYGVILAWGLIAICMSHIIWIRNIIRCKPSFHSDLLYG